MDISVHYIVFSTVKKKKNVQMLMSAFLRNFLKISHLLKYTNLQKVTFYICHHTFW